MDLTQQDIENFRRLWKKEFSENLSFEAARTEAHRLLELYALLARPLPRTRSLHEE